MRPFTTSIPHRNSDSSDNLNLQSGPLDLECGTIRASRNVSGRGRPRVANGFAKTFTQAIGVISGAMRKGKKDVSPALALSKTGRKREEALVRRPIQVGRARVTVFSSPIPVWVCRVVMVRTHGAITWGQRPPPTPESRDMRCRDSWRWQSLCG